MKIPFSQIKILQRVKSLIFVHIYFEFWGEGFRPLLSTGQHSVMKRKLSFSVCGNLEKGNCDDTNMSYRTNTVLLYFAILVNLNYSFLPVDIEDVVETLPVPEKYY